MSETRPYQPSNGTEGEGFVAFWCDRCLHDRAVRLHEDYDNGCPILARAYAFKPGDPDYPTEWVEDADSDQYTARCTAFIEDDHDDDWEPPPPPDPTQLVLIADPTEDIAGITAPPQRIEVPA